jgi:hypothetical protein
VVSLSQSLCAVAVSRAQRRICESANIHAVGGLTRRAHSGDARWQCAPLSHATRREGSRKVRQCSAVCTWKVTTGLGVGCVEWRRLVSSWPKVEGPATRIDMPLSSCRCMSCCIFGGMLCHGIRYLTRTQGHFKPIECYRSFKLKS